MALLAHRILNCLRLLHALQPHFPKILQLSLQTFFSPPKHFFVSKHLYLTTLKSSCVKSCLNGRFSCLNGHKSAVSIFLQVFLLLQLLYFHAVLCQMCHAIFLHCFSRCLSLFHVALTLTCCSSQN